MQGGMQQAGTRMRSGFGRFGGGLALILIGLGLCAVLLGWNGAASHIAPAAQFPFIVSGLGVGFVFSITGAALMVVQSAREDRALLEAKLDQVIAALSRQSAGSGPIAPANLAGLVVAGSASYHVPGCRLVDGREEVAYLTPDEARARWLAPCRVCRPEHTTVRA